MILHDRGRTVDPCCNNMVGLEMKRKDRFAQTPIVVFVVALHYERLQIIVLLLQACLLEIYLFCKI